MNVEWEKSQRLIIGYIINSQNPDAMRKALTQLKDEYFTEECGFLFTVMRKWFMKSSSILNKTILREIWRAKKQDETRLLMFEELLQDCQELAEKLTYNEFLWFVDRIVVIFKENRFKSLLEHSTLILNKDGYNEAKSYFLQGINGLENINEVFGVDNLISEDVQGFYNDVLKAGKESKADRIYLGFPDLDANIGGFRGGDTVLIVGWTGVGKTTFLINVCVDAVFKQKRNVVYVTTETIKPQIQRRLFSRLSKSDKVCKVPLSSSKLKVGNLTTDEFKSLEELKKYVESPEHGKLIIVQAPFNATMVWLRGKLLEIEQKFPVHLLLLDDLRNIRPTKRRGSEWEEFNDLLKDFKAVARTHAGRGIPIISPYQVSREAYKKAMEGEDRGHYDLSALSSSSEAERTADFILALWEEKDIRNEMRAEILKFRDGRKGAEFILKTNLDFQFMEEQSTGESLLNFF